MGPCSSYDDIEAMDTSTANEIIANSDIIGVVLPSNISSSVFEQFTADNNDNMKTLLTVTGQPTPQHWSFFVSNRWLPNRVQHCVHIQEECSLHDGTPWPELCWRAIDHGTVPDVCQNRNT